MASEKVTDFQSLSENVGKFELKNKTFLIPQMNRVGGHLLAATFRGFGIHAKVMDTYEALDLGNEYTSGKECFPCQITTGDILHFMQKEKDRLGNAFNAEDYVFFMPESDGPCRFGMYNKYQRIVLDSFPGLDKLKIGALTTTDGYSLAGIIERDKVRDLRKAAYLSVVVADILDRLLWRIRPYEKEEGMADDFIEGAMRTMEGAFERYGPKKDFEEILKILDRIIEDAKGIIDPEIPPKPLIGVVGEIYLRTHVQANQDVIRMLEKYGGEVVNASIAEWMNYTSYDRLRDSKIGLRLNLKQGRFKEVKKCLTNILSFWTDLSYQQFTQKRVYKRAKSAIDIAGDHKMGHLEALLKESGLFTFDVGTEACISIAGILAYAREGFNGVVNVYPFTCMPSTTTSAVIKPVTDKLGLPFLDAPYDSSIQPGRESAIRTFMYQATQHYKRHGRKQL